MTTSNPPGSHAGGGDRRQTVDFDLFGGEGESGDVTAANEALEKTAGQVDFDVFGAAEPAAEPSAGAPAPENVDFDIFGAAGDKTHDNLSGLHDSDMDAEDATRFTASPTAGEAAAAAPFVAPKPAPAPTQAPAPAPEAKSGVGKIVAIVIVIAAIAAAAWFFLR